MTKFNNIAVVCVLALMSKAAVAMPMDYTFDVIFDTGPVAGQTESVFVTLDGVTGVGVETFTPLTGMLAFSFSFGGFDFDIFDDRDYPVSPAVVLRDAALDAVDYFTDSSVVPSARIQARVGFSNDVAFDVFPQGVSTGDVAFNSWREVESEEVPAPGTIALFALGLMGLGLQRRKRVAHS